MSRKLAKKTPFAYTAPIYMPRTCLVSKKTAIIGFSVSHSKRHIKKRLHPNLQKRRLLNPATGRLIRVLISTTGLRTLKKCKTAGKKYDLAKLAQAVN